MDKLCTIEKSVKFYVIYDRPVPRKPFYVPLRIQRKQTMSKMRKKKSRCGLINLSAAKSLICDRHRPCYSRVTYFLRIILVLSLCESCFAITVVSLHFPYGSYNQLSRAIKDIIYFRIKVSVGVIKHVKSGQTCV